jgi:mRNA degradation ribonuclease J1/J2
VDGPVVGDAGELHLDERRRMGWTGVVAARLRASRKAKRWTTVVDLQAIGCPVGDGKMLGEAATYAAEQVAALPITSDAQALEQTLVASIRSFFRRRLDRKPSVLPFVEVKE